jgi:hypothetical protein
MAYNQVLMKLGLDTFIFHLDLISDSAWTAFKIWNGGTLSGGKVVGGEPLFAGRNFLGGDFIWGHAEATNAWNEVAGALAATDPSPAHPENLVLSVPLIAPVQAPHSARQGMAGERGFIAGAIDADAICERLFRSILTGEFSLQPKGFVQVWLAVDFDSPFSVDYWAGWSDKVNSFGVFTPPGTLYPTSILQPFMAGILCRYMGPPGGSLKRDPNVNAVLKGTRADPSYSKLNTTCLGFWADAPDPDEDGVRPAPALDWTRFQRDEMPSIWRVAGAIRTAEGNPVNEMFSVDAVKDPAADAPQGLGPIATDLMLSTNKWQPSAPTSVNAGFSSTDAITNARIPCLQSTSLPDMGDNGFPARGHFNVRGGTVAVVGRYVRHNPAFSISAEEAKRLSDARIRIFTTWESVRPLGAPAGGQAALGDSEPSLDQRPVGSWGAFQNNFHKNIYYFNPVLNAGYQDGMEAFTYCSQVLRQPPQTPVFFAIDFDPLDLTVPNSWPALPDNAARQAWVLSYFSQVKTARDDFAAQNPDHYYLIGMYCCGEVLRWCYQQGIVSSFWQPLSYGHHGSQPPQWPWCHANRWQYRENVAFCGIGGADPDTDWGDGGDWSLADPLTQRLNGLEDREGGAILLNFFRGLLDL